MYPVTLGFDEAISRIEKLRDNEFYGESLLTAVFTAEKSLRRTLKFLVISAGFKNKSADKIISKCNGLQALKDAWTLYEPNEQILTKVLGDQNWYSLKKASEVRNKLIHGERVYSDEEYSEHLHKLLPALASIIEKLETTYNFSGWSKMPTRKKSKLHTDSKIKK